LPNYLTLIYRHKHRTNVAPASCRLSRGRPAHAAAG